MLFVAVILTFYTIAPIGRGQLKENPLDAMRIFRVLIVIITLFGSFAGCLLSQGRVVRAKSIFCYLLFCGFACFSALYSSYSGLSLYKAIELMADVVLLLFISTFINKREDVKGIIDTFYAAAWYLILTTFVGLLFYSEIALPWTRSDVLPFRLTGVFPIVNTNELSQLASVVFFISLNRAVVSEKQTVRFQHLAALVLAFGTILLACSRTTLLTVVVLVFFLCWHWKSFVLLSILGVASISVVFYNLAGLASRYFLRGESLESILNVGGRMAIWPLFWQSFLESPVLGKGYYAAHRFFDLAELRKHGLSGQSISGTDNVILEVMLGLGLIGLAICSAFLLFTYGDIRSTWKKIRNRVSVEKETRVLLAEIFGIFIVILLRSLTGPTFQVHSFNSIFLAGLMVSAYRLRKVGERD